jgi:hypothetical protein
MTTRLGPINPAAAPCDGPAGPRPHMTPRQMLYDKIVKTAFSSVSFISNNLFRSIRSRAP